MWAMILKEFRELRRDRRTVAMMVALPVLFLVIFGYAASFDISRIPTVVTGPGAEQVAPALPSLLDVVRVEPTASRSDAVDMMRRGTAVVSIVTGAAGPEILIDGSELFSAKAAESALGRLTGSGSGGSSLALQNLRVEVLFNPELKTSAVMIPALVGMILLFVGTVVTSLGVVRERQAGTMEQLAVMPLKPRDVFMGKVAPYFAVAAVDMTVIVIAGTALFHVPFTGSPVVLALGALLFLFVTLGLGVLVSSVSENQGQAIQLAVMTMLPQVLLSGLVFPVSSMALGVRWISYLLPLTYFIQISRGVMLRGAPIGALGRPFGLLAVLGAVVFTLAVLRFRKDLAPSGRQTDAAGTGEALA